MVGRLALGTVFFLCVNTASACERTTINFNLDWKFTKSDPPGAARPDFNDSGWTNVSAPHTYNDTDTFDDWTLPGHRGEQNQFGGRTWYRKTFTLPPEDRGKKVYIEFEAVRQVAEVYLNGTLLGACKTGFTPFGFDLTPHLRFDHPNVLAVMCDNRFMKDPFSAEDASGEGQPRRGDPLLSELSAKVNATIPDDVADLQANQIPWNNPHWHPAHGGIYRNVYLYVTDPLHISLPLYSFLQTEGTYVYATDISEKSATVNIEVPIENGRASAESIELRANVLDRNGRPVLKLKQSAEIGAGAHGKVTLSGILKNPQLWEPACPYLYRVVCSLRANGQAVDTNEITFGIRNVRWDAQTGFYINGHHLKLHGWGQKPTDEWPGLGAAQPDWVHFLTMCLMKDAGGNFVRWGHCAGPPASLTAADELGIITEQPGVDGESDTRGGAWALRASAFRDMIIFFRNHPSILIWEGGNQKVSRAHAQELHSYVEQYDPHGGRAYAHRRADATTAQFMDIGIGTEGGREIARLPVVEGEYDREESPRRVWDDQSPPRFGYPEARGQTYALTSEQYAVNQVSQYVGKLGAPDHCGGANWIFSDSTSGGRVCCEVTRASGEVDGARLPKEAYYVCQAMFRADPQVHIIGHWTYPAGTKKTIYVAANGDDVELFLNGKSLGHGKNSDRYLFTFPDIAWQPGQLKAVSYLDGKPVATDIRRTAGEPVALKLTTITGPDGFRADGSDVAFIDVEAVDAHGERCPTYEDRVDFSLDGPAIWRGGYNSGKTNSINASHLDLECGVNRVAVRATRQSGPVTVRATAKGLKPGNVTLNATSTDPIGALSQSLPAMPVVALPRGGKDLAAGDTMPPLRLFERNANPGTGRFVSGFSYSGPTANAGVEQDAEDGKKIYLDRDYAFVGLPPELAGGDFIRTANSDKTYNAEDLMELAVKSGTIVSIAHDDRLPRPGWLTRQFTPTSLHISVNKQRMTVFQHTASGDESLTLGANTETENLRSCNMYVIFVTAPPEPQTEHVLSRTP